MKKLKQVSQFLSKCAIEDFIQLLHPTMAAWALQCDYAVPAPSWFLQYRVEFIPQYTWDSPYGGASISACGSHNMTTRLIKVSYHNRPLKEQLQILAHEFAHAVQHFSTGEVFSEQYAKEATQPHSINKFENEARKLERMFMVSYDCGRFNGLILDFIPTKKDMTWQQHMLKQKANYARACAAENTKRQRNQGWAYNHDNNEYLDKKVTRQSWWLRG